MALDRDHRDAGRRDRELEREVVAGDRLQQQRREEGAIAPGGYSM